MDSGKPNSRSVNNVAASEIFLFSTQVIAILLVIVVSLINLTFEWGNQNLWTLLLTASLGYIMPNPKMDILTNAMKSNKGEDGIEA